MSTDHGQDASLPIVEDPLTIVGEAVRAAVSRPWGSGRRAATMRVGARVRLLRRAERDATGLPWAVEVGRIVGHRYRDLQRVSVHRTMNAAAAALCRLLSAGAPAEAAHGETT